MWTIFLFALLVAHLAPANLQEIVDFCTPENKAFIIEIWNRCITTQYGSPVVSVGGLKKSADASINILTNHRVRRQIRRPYGGQNNYGVGYSGQRPYGGQNNYGVGYSGQRPYGGQNNYRVAYNKPRPMSGINVQSQRPIGGPIRGPNIQNGRGIRPQRFQQRMPVGMQGQSRPVGYQNGGRSANYQGGIQRGCSQSVYPVYPDPTQYDPYQCFYNDIYTYGVNYNSLRSVLEEQDQYTSIVQLLNCCGTECYVANGPSRMQMGGGRPQLGGGAMQLDGRPQLGSGVMQSSGRPQLGTGEMQLNGRPQIGGRAVQYGNRPQEGSGAIQYGGRPQVGGRGIQYVDRPPVGGGAIQYVDRPPVGGGAIQYVDRPPVGGGAIQYSGKPQVGGGAIQYVDRPPVGGGSIQYSGRPQISGGVPPLGNQQPFDGNGGNLQLAGQPQLSGGASVPYHVQPAGGHIQFDSLGGQIGMTEAGGGYQGGQPYSDGQIREYGPSYGQGSSFPMNGGPQGNGQTGRFPNGDYQPSQNDRFQYDYGNGRYGQPPMRKSSGQASNHLSGELGGGSTGIGFESSSSSRGGGRIPIQINDGHETQHVGQLDGSLPFEGRQSPSGQISMGRPSEIGFESSSSGKGGSASIPFNSGTGNDYTNYKQQQGQIDGTVSLGGRPLEVNRGSDHQERWNSDQGGNFQEKWDSNQDGELQGKWNNNQGSDGAGFKHSGDDNDMEGGGLRGKGKNGQDANWKGGEITGDRDSNGGALKTDWKSGQGGAGVDFKHSGGDNDMEGGGLRGKGKNGQDANWKGGEITGDRDSNGGALKTDWKSGQGGAGVNFKHSGGDNDMEGGGLRGKGKNGQDANWKGGEITGDGDSNSGALKTDWKSGQGGAGVDFKHSGGDNDMEGGGLTGKGKNGLNANWKGGEITGDGDSNGGALKTDWKSGQGGAGVDFKHSGGYNDMEGGGLRGKGKNGQDANWKGGEITGDGDSNGGALKTDWKSGQGGAGVDFKHSGGDNDMEGGGLRGKGKNGQDANWKGGEITGDGDSNSGALKTDWKSGQGGAGVHFKHSGDDNDMEGGGLRGKGKNGLDANWKGGEITGDGDSNGGALKTDWKSGQGGAGVNFKHSGGYNDMEGGGLRGKGKNGQDANWKGGEITGDGDSNGGALKTDWKSVVPLKLIGRVVKVVPEYISSIQEMTMTWKVVVLEEKERMD
ncbi:hypothetical protein CHUAL_008248 [Chamberlinius hualienensis]